MSFPKVSFASVLQPGIKRLYVGAYGFEDRSLGWVNSQRGKIIWAATVFRYRHPKGRNRVGELKQKLRRLGARSIKDICCDVRSPQSIERILSNAWRVSTGSYDEIILDISAMTKLLILVSLFVLREFRGTLRIVYSEPTEYPPSQEEYEGSKKGMELVATFPNRGVESIIRMKCMSSIRMQGQPVSMVAFTSFNEQLVRHMLGTISPHRLIFINGRPPHAEYEWREYATQEIHGRLIEEYLSDNPIGSKRLLSRASSTLDYRESIEQIEEIYERYGKYERIIAAATGSKMQTVGLYFSKILHPDIHIEYPTPDSYFIKNIGSDVRKVYQVKFPAFQRFVNRVTNRER